MAVPSPSRARMGKLLPLLLSADAVGLGGILSGPCRRCRANWNRQSSIVSFTPQYIARAVKKSKTLLLNRVAHSHPHGWGFFQVHRTTDMDVYSPTCSARFGGGRPYCSLILTAIRNENWFSSVVRFRGRWFHSGTHQPAFPYRRVKNAEGKLPARE